MKGQEVPNLGGPAQGSGDQHCEESSGSYLQHLSDLQRSKPSSARKRDCFARSLHVFFQMNKGACLRQNRRTHVLAMPVSDTLFLNSRYFSFTVHAETTFPLKRNK